MTQVLSKLSGRQHVNKLAIASSAAALAFWTYLNLKGSLDKHGTRSSRAGGSIGESKQPQQQQQVLFLDKKAEQAKRRKKRPDISVTLKHLSIILKSIMNYRDVALCCGVTMGLILRTLLDLWNIRISTQVESAIITANRDQLKQTLIAFSLTMPTMAFVNNIIKYFTDKLSLRIRYNLSRELYNRYMHELTFYRLSNTQLSQEFQNVDQLLTADVDKFASSIVEVYNNLSKPILDIILLVHRMTTSYTGPQTPAIMIGWLAIVGSILTTARKPLAGYLIRETQSEGQLRFVHSRLIQNNEEIAFFRGNEKEKFTLMSALDMLRSALDDLILFKFKIGFMDNIVGRYSSTVVGYLALAMPFFSARYSDASGEERLNQYYVSGRMMMKLAESITRVILAGQDLSKLSAYTQRVKSLMDTMDELKDYETKQSTLVGGNKSKSPSTANATTLELTSEASSVEICDRENPMIDFKNVTLSTPNGDILVKNLTFTIKQKQSVIISGPNGSGKSSLFRVLGNLWRVESGKVIRPPTDQLFYICQKPYMTLGSLRNQIIFPDTTSKYTDEQLVEILNVVELKYLLDRGEHNLDSINDWQDVLSGGEKQRMALSRLIYHKPQFAILDECTSAVAIDVEQRIYKYLSEDLGCTLLSVSHRVRQLAKFHHLILEFDGNGNFEFKRLKAPL